MNRIARLLALVAFLASVVTGLVLTAAPSGALPDVGGGISCNAGPGAVACEVTASVG